MPSHDIVVVGASAGGIEALQNLVSLLPADLPAAIFIVQHTTSDGTSRLPDILSRRGPLRASIPLDGEEIHPGRIYVAPNDRHLLLEPGHMRVVRGPRENRHRPAIDPLFRSAAWAYGPRVVGVVLTGYLDDGTAGLWAIKTCGGVTVVQSSDDAQHAEMPESAAAATPVDYTLPVAEVAPLLERLAREPVRTEATSPPESIKSEIEFAKMDRDITEMAKLGTLSSFTCPACRGALWELQDSDVLRYRCHTGHAYTQDSLLGGQTVSIEEALYTALRAVEEKIAVLRRLRDRHAGRANKLGQEYEKRASELEQTTERLRSMLTGAVI